MDKTLLVHEQRDLAVPPGINETLLRAGGINPFGGPKYRCVYGYQRLEFVGGQWADGFIGFRPLPKYTPPDRYYLEFWLEPESFGTPTQWREHTSKVIQGITYETLGDYPSRGDYEQLWKVETPAGAYLEPTVSMMDHFVRLHKQCIARSRWDIARGQQARRDAERRAYEQKRDGILAEAGDKFITQAMRGRTVRELKGEMEAIMPANHPRPSVTALKHAS